MLFKHRLALALVGVAAISTAAATPAASSKAPPQTMTVAAISTVEYRASIIAHKTSAEPPTAHVTVAIKTRAAGSWTPPAVHALRGVYFWNTLRGPHSICQLEIETAGGVAHRPVLLVRLLASPALGCGQIHSFPLPTQ